MHYLDSFRTSFDSSVGEIDESILDFILVTLLCLNSAQLHALNNEFCLFKWVFHGCFLNVEAKEIGAESRKERVKRADEGISRNTKYPPLSRLPSSGDPENDSFTKYFKGRVELKNSARMPSNYSVWLAYNSVNEDHDSLHAKQLLGTGLEEERTTLTWQRPKAIAI